MAKNIQSTYDSYIGKKVRKISSKPFKSGEKVNTVKGITTNEHTGRLAFTFEEDDSNVECYSCREMEV